MYSTFLLASILAVLPFISATPTRPRDPTSSPTIVPNVNLTNGAYYTYEGCYKFPTGLSAVNLLQNSGEITIDNCVATCDAGMYAKGGVGYNKCYCGGARANSGTPADNGDCQQLLFTCLGNPLEYCESTSTLPLYTKRSSV